MKLIVVESPAKAKTISKYLKGDYKVVASVGHIRDLPKSNKQAIDIPAGFVPRYEISKGKEKVVHEIRRLAKKADEVLLATDPDREGEAIAWHIKEACELVSPKRVVFHEITEPAVQEAITHPRAIDENLRRAQEARRVLDRLVGYDLSGLIWKKVRYGLSAGRVQSPALRIIMEREREIRAFVPEHFWSIVGRFKTKRGEELILACEEEPRDEKKVEEIIARAKSGAWAVTAVKHTEAKRAPRPPFTTSTLQQTASTRFGFSPSRTMSVAQRLYEAGLITYMRTDSVNLSEIALAEAYRTIEKEFGKEYVAPRKYAARSKNAQEAHEAIRPTKPALRRAGTTDEQQRLYELVSQRMLASQMADARVLRTKVSANLSPARAGGAQAGIADNSIPPFSATGSVTIFPGWLAADPAAKGEEVEMPVIAEGEPLKLASVESDAKQTEPPARYTEAGLVKELEKRDIGRPSTYASILKTLQDRSYVEKVQKALHPTDTGEVVSDFLEKHFPTYISDSFTAEMEDDLDEIAKGKREYAKTLKDFYTPFAKDVKAKENVEKATNLGDAEAYHVCPLCGSPMVIKLARSGKFLSCKRFPECIGARKMDGSVMEAPKETGEACPKCGATKGGKLIEREGRFGKFIACSNYPKCKFIKQSEEEEEKKKTGVACPLCPPTGGGGEIIERRGRFGAFFSCSHYPKCKFIMKSRPTGAKCPLCGSLMMQGTKTIPERCSSKSCPNHNPHKLNK